MAFSRRLCGWLLGYDVNGVLVEIEGWLVNDYKILASSIHRELPWEL